MEENNNEEKKDNEENKENIDNGENKNENKEEINNSEEKKENNEEKNEKIKEELDLEETDDGINKEDINNIVDYLTNLDFEKYSRDMEIKEALMVLKAKMDKDQEIKEKEKAIDNKDKVTIIEDNNIISNNKTEEKIINKIEDKKIKEIKEPKEIINEEEIKKKEEIKKYKLAEKIAKSDNLKEVHSVKSVQKLLMRENIDNQAPLRITIIKESPLASCDGYIPNKLPFLHSLPLV